MIDLSVIIVSFNTKNLLEKCLLSLHESSNSFKYEVIVIDNGSDDDSAEMVKKQFKEVILLKSDHNLGFGAANNLAAQKSRGKYLLFLNSDAYVFPETIEKLLKLSHQNSAEIASCRLLNKDGSIQPQGGCLPNLINITAWMTFLDDIPILKKLFCPYQQREENYFKHDHQMGWLGGTALLIKNSVFEKINGFDPGIFMYGEDVDLCLRAEKLGIKRFFFNEPVITHIGQGSSDSAFALHGEYKGLIYLFQKHKKTYELLYLKLMLKLGAFLRILIFGMILKDENKRKAYIEAFRVV